LSFGLSIAHHPAVHPELRRACAAEPVYVRLGAIVHDLPYYGNMLVEAVRYGLESAAIDEPWAYRMHSVKPARFVASFLRAAQATPGLERTERLALAAGLLSHCALDLTLHPLVNYCARRDTFERGGHESVHHRRAEKAHALFLHLERLKRDPIGSAEFREWTRVVKAGSLVRARVEAPIAELIERAYQGAYGGAPARATWAGWVRSFAHFGLLVGTPWAARNSARVRQSSELRARYWENDVFSFHEFYACAERRLSELVNLGHAYIDAGDFSATAEEEFIAQARIDDLAEPTPQPIDRLPPLLTLRVTCTPGLSRPTLVPEERRPLEAAA
jgi:hypothetical protein